MDTKEKSEITNPKNWDRVIMHVDMDAFFAAIEIRNDPSLKGKPVIVGGPADKRGVVSACSYEAREFGVHSGMPMARAQRLCPDGVIIGGSLEMYGHVSTQMIKILLDYTPLVEPVSVDEAFLDVTGSMKIWSEPLSHAPLRLARDLKKRIKENLDLTCSVGVGQSRIIAKMASKLEKPDGLTILSRKRYRELFAQKPVSVLWGVGEKTAHTLNRMKIITVADLIEFPADQLIKRMGKSAIWLKTIAKGDDAGKVHALDHLPDEKSISHETTFAKDSTDLEYLRTTLLALSVKVARRLRRSEFLAKTVSLKVRSDSFKTITRDKTLSQPTDDQTIIFKTALALLPEEFRGKIPVRLLGVKADSLVKRNDLTQLSLFTHGPDSHNQSMSKLNKTIDSIKERFGDSSVKPGTLIR